VGKRALWIAAACAAVLLIGGLVSYQVRGNDKTSTTTATISPGSTLAAHGKAIIDGQNQDVQGSCNAPADGRSINISLSGAPPTKINVTLDNAQPPNVSSVVLGASSMAFLYEPGREGSAEATRDGNTYHIKGTLLRYGFVSKPFDIKVTCS
jgi:hypothetical protein